MAKLKHSKFRNSGFLFELLVRQISSDILNNTKDNIAENLLRKYFNVSTELGQECALYNSLQKEKYTTEYRADKFIDVIIDARKKLDERKLNTQKYNLIKEIKQNFDIDKFVSQPIKNYKIVASIYKLFESNMDGKYQPKDSFSSRNTIIENIIEKPLLGNSSIKSDRMIENFKKESKDLRMLTHKILLDKFNEKYGNLSIRQKLLLKEYINNMSDTEKMSNFIHTEINNICKSLRKQQNQVDDTVMSIKLDETISQLKNTLKSKTVKDNHVTSLLISYELVDELKLKLEKASNG